MIGRLLIPNSVRLRLTLWFALALFAVLASYLAVLYSGVRHNLFSDLDRNLRSDVESAQEVLSEIRTRPEAMRSLERQDRWVIEVWSYPDRAMVAAMPSASRSTLGPPPEACSRQKISYRNFTLKDGLRVRAGCRIYPVGGDELAIQGARPAERVHEELRHLLLTMLLGLPVALGLAVAGGYLVTGKALRPVARMTEQAHNISVERLGERLEVKNPDDELGRLATTFNLTFERLEGAFDNMRRFTADASHELRTPLAAIRTIGEVALRTTPGSSESAHALANILEEADRLRHLIESLLTLSRADAGRIKLEPRDVDLAGLARDVSAHLEVLAEEKNQAIDLDLEHAPVHVDAAILRQAVINLVDNAIKYSPQHSRIALRTRTEPGLSILEVSDQGPGIAMEHRERIFERFYRIDSGRTRDQGGTGLGLSIAAWAVKANGGEITVDSQVDGGSTFRITLPYERIVRNT